MNLTKPQKLIYDMEKFAGGSISNICGSLFITTDKSVEAIKTVVNELYRLNDSLRFRICEDSESPTLHIKEYEEKDIEVLCFESKEEFDAYASDYTKEPINLFGCLSEIKAVLLPDKKGIIAKLHHIISDAWTLSLLCTQFIELLQGNEIKAYSYIDYIDTEEKYIDSDRYIKDKEYFISQFQKCDQTTYLSDKKEKNFYFLNLINKT